MSSYQKQVSQTHSHLAPKKLIMKTSFELSPCSLKFENQVKEFFVRELGKNLIFKSSFDASSPNSMVYLATCLAIDSSLSPENFVKDFGVLQSLGTSACRT